MLIDHNLAEVSPVESYTKVMCDSIFIGSIIRHQYDERRIHLNSFKQNEPQRLLFCSNNTNIQTYLYGYHLKPRGVDSFLLSKLKKYTALDTVSYNNILQEFNYTFTESTPKLGCGIYPIDSVHIKKYIPEYSYQAVIKFDEDLPNFQQFTNILMLALIPDGYGLNTIL